MEQSSDAFCTKQCQGLWGSECQRVGGRGDRDHSVQACKGRRLTLQLHGSKNNAHTRPKLNEAHRAASRRRGGASAGVPSKLSGFPVVREKRQVSEFLTSLNKIWQNHVYIA